MKIQFIDDCAKWYRMWSNQLALAVAAAASWAVDNQATVLGWIDAIPQPYRSVLTFLTVAGIPITLRMIDQAKTKASTQ